MLGSKVEINLRKAEPGRWSTLELPAEKIAKSEQNDEIEEFEWSHSPDCYKLSKNTVGNFIL